MSERLDFDGKTPRTVAAIFLDGDDDEDLLRAGTCILAALLVGPVNGRVAKLTGVPVNDVRNYGFRLRRADIWRPGHGGMFYPWLDEVLDGRGKIGFILHAMVATGDVVRYPETDEYRRATILDGLSGYAVDDPATADAPCRFPRRRLTNPHRGRKVLP